MVKSMNNELIRLYVYAYAIMHIFKPKNSFCIDTSYEAAREKQMKEESERVSKEPGARTVHWTLNVLTLRTKCERERERVRVWLIWITETCPIIVSTTATVYFQPQLCAVRIYVTYRIVSYFLDNKIHWK